MGEPLRHIREVRAACGEHIQSTGSNCCTINIVVELLVLDGEFTTVQLQRAPGRDGIGSSNEGDIDDLEMVFR